ncbi:tripartite tricarboxylate transporter permease [Halocatena pleomorpha]|uniref:DUF112 domain-containing protein n=1 Tax=Halocatena pleomorpha TaxID=1785090 RepID=A0A3P3RBC2_9EURY|nr:tripartite tricarboxylate transporter permease [Halocatena pleomorpha]RRJ30238.1 hypothetical protein EIK79_09950 [Halocatena pleomorpha]
MVVETVVVAPERTVAVLAFVAAGCLFGTVSGLVPGLHANNMAFLLAALAPSIPGSPPLVGAAMLAAGVVHSFLDIAPMLALGVPDPAMAVSALPGHRLVLEGRGREALCLSALGSGLAVVLSVPLAVPLTVVMVGAEPVISTHQPLVLGAIVLALLGTEPTRRGIGGGVLAFAASAGLGIVALDLPTNPALAVGSVLTPLFTGLFGAPVLIDAMEGNGIPEQRGGTVTLSARSVCGLGGVGSLCGAIVGYIPGVSSAIAATLALVTVPGRYGARGFVVATSGVNTANTIFALFALVSLGAPRTGVLVALKRANVPIDLPLLLAAVVIAAVVGFCAVLSLGDPYLRLVGAIDYTTLSIGVLGLLCLVSYLFAGLIGIGVFAASTVVGLLPVRLDVQRAHLMGVLLGPLILGQ